MKRYVLRGSRSFFLCIYGIAFIALALLSGNQCNAQTINTIAGNFNGDGLPATYGHIKVACGVVTDASGNVYISDPSFHRIRKINTAGIISTYAGTARGYSGDGGLATNARLNTPRAIVMDNTGCMYIADDSNNVVRKVDASGIITTIAGNGNRVDSGDGGLATMAGIHAPKSICLDAAGNLYIGNKGWVRKVDTSGIITTIAGNGSVGHSGDGGSATSAQIGLPISIFFDGSGNLIIVDMTYYMVRKVTPAGVISTIAGDGTGGTTGDGGPATAAKLQFLMGGGVDANGNIYVADYQVIRKIDTNGIITAFAGNRSGVQSGDGGPAIDAGTGSLSCVGIDPSGNVYIGDGGKLRKVNTSGIINTIVGNGGYNGDGSALTRTFIQTNSVAADRKGNVYFSSQWDQRVWKVHSGAVTTVAGDGVYDSTGDGGPSSAARLNSPFGLVTDTIGNLYIVDQGNRRIRKVDTNGIISTFKRLPTTAYDLCVDKSGNVYVSSADSRVYKITPAGTMTVFAGNGTPGFSGDGGPATAAKLNLPEGLAADNAGNVYIADYANNRLRKVSTTGVITTVAGTGTAGYTGDGGAATAANISLFSLAIDNSGTLFFGSRGIIRKVNPSGIISTYAGNIVEGYDGDGGPASAAQLSGIEGLSCDKNGNLYVADFNNAVVRVVYPLVQDIVGGGSVCTGGTLSLSDATPGGTWSSGNTAVATVGSSSGILSAVAPGTATITYTIAAGAYATTMVTVSAPAAVSTITGTAIVCPGYSTTLSNAMTGGTWSSSDETIAIVGSGNGIVAGISGGTTTISYTVSTGCGSAVATQVVTVNAPTISGTLLLCAGLTSTLSAGAPGGTWTINNAAVATIGATTGLLTSVGEGTANISYSSGAGCTATVIVTVTSLGVIAGTSNTCVGQTATLTNVTPGGTWNSSNTSLATVDASTGIVTGIAAGTVTISYIMSTGCYRTIAFTVKALSPAIAAPVVVCAGSTIMIPPPSSNGLSWSSSNTSVATIGSSSGALTGVSVGTTTLTYTTITGCFITTEATVNAAPSAITGTTALCTGYTSSLSSATPGGTWSSSSTAIASIGSATGVVITPGSAGTATISYTVAGCPATTVVTVSLIAAITGTPNLCIGSLITLADASSGGTWSSSNTSIASVDPSSGVTTGVAAGNATITYTIASGCTRTITATVIATPGAIGGSITVCPGSTTTLSSSSTGGTWSGSNAAIAIVNTYTGVLSGIVAGTITITYTVAGCGTTGVATVNPLPAVIAGTTNACVAQTATLIDATAGGAWTSNNTSIAAVDVSTGVVTGVSAGTTMMTYTLGTGCRRMVTFTVKALPPTVASPVAACVGTNTAIPPPSTNGKSWSSSNTTVATIGSSNGILTGASTGTTTLTYTTITGCFVTTEATVYALPSAGTITGPATVVVGSSITLDDAAGGGIWSSSVASRASIGSASGIVTGITGGPTTISYSVSNPGCTVRATKLISVVASRPGDNGQSINSSIQLYPNPTTGAFTLVSDEAGKLQLFSIDGKELISYSVGAGTNALSLPTDLASGIYMCRFIGDNGSTTMVRLVFER